ncbi:MAG: hypothetical protein V7744_10190 [Pseudomonadales bacterium]
MRNLIVVIIMLLVTACVQQPVSTSPGELATLKSWASIISIDGKTSPFEYSAELLAGNHKMVVLHKTYRWNYRCHFDFVVQPNTYYELISSTNKTPLTLYRWERTNSLWATRYDGVEPTSCDQEKP